MAVDEVIDEAITEDLCLESLGGDEDEEPPTEKSSGSCVKK